MTTIFLTLKNVKILFLFVTIILFIIGYVDLDKDLGNKYANTFTQPYQIDNEKLDDVFKLKYNYYKNTLIELKSIQKWMLIIIIISMLVLIFGVSNIPFFGFTIPDNLIYLVIYFGGIYLWINFGLTFNTAIDDRLTLLTYIDNLELDKDLIYNNSAKHILLDNSLLDNWFGWNFNTFGGAHPINKPFQFLGLFLLYGSILGLYVSCIMVSTLEFLKRKKIAACLKWFLVIFMISMLLLSTISFTVKEKIYAIFWMATIWGISTIGLFYWDHSGLKIFNRNKSIFNKNKN